MSKSKISVVQYIEQQLAVCGKTQRQIATEIGYANPNIIAMFKTGTTKVPIAKIAPLAKALSVDPAYFLRLVMTEYMPEAWEAIEGMLGADNLTTQQDREVARLVREATGDVPVDLSIPENRRTLEDTIKAIVARDQAKAKASVDRMSTLPRNSRERRQ